MSKVSKANSKSNAPQSSQANKSIFKIIANELEILKQIARDKNNPEMICSRVSDTITILEKRLMCELKGKPEEQFHDFVVEFYESKMEAQRQEIARILKENHILCTNIAEFQNSMRGLNFGEGFNSQGSAFGQETGEQFANTAKTISLTKKLEHSKRIVENNQRFIDQQNITISALRQEIKRFQGLVKDSRNRYEEKIRKLDDLQNRTNSHFQTAVKQFELQTTEIYKQITELEASNLEFVQQKSKFEDLYNVKCEEVKIFERKLYDFSLETIKKQKEMGQLMKVCCQNDESIKIYEAETRALKEKNWYLAEQWELKIQSKHQAIQILQSQVGQERAKSKICTEEMSLLVRKNNQQELTMQKLSDKLSNQLFKSEQLSKQLLSYENDEYSWKQENLKLTQKVEHFQGLMTEHSSTIKKQEDLLSSGQDSIQSEREKSEGNLVKLKRDLKNQTSQAASVKSKLESRIKRLETEKTELYEDKSHLIGRQKELQLSLSHLKDNFRQISEQKQLLTQEIGNFKEECGRLSNTNEVMLQANTALQSHLSQLQKEVQGFQQLDSSQLLSTEKRIVLENKLIESDKNIKEMSSEIEKLLSENSKLRSKFSGDSKKQAEMQRGEEMHRRDFQIRQLQNKVNILQEELRETDKTSSIEKNRLSGKIKELESLLSERHSYTHRLASLG